MKIAPFIPFAIAIVLVAVGDALHARELSVPGARQPGTAGPAQQGAGPDAAGEARAH